MRGTSNPTISPQNFTTISGMCIDWSQDQFWRLSPQNHQIRWSKPARIFKLNYLRYKTRCAKHPIQNETNNQIINVEFLKNYEDPAYYVSILRAITKSSNSSFTRIDARIQAPKTGIVASKSLVIKNNTHRPQHDPKQRRNTEHPKITESRQRNMLQCYTRPDFNLDSLKIRPNHEDHTRTPAHTYHRQ